MPDHGDNVNGKGKMTDVIQFSPMHLELKRCAKDCDLIRAKYKYFYMYINFNILENVDNYWCN